MVPYNYLLNLIFPRINLSCSMLPRLVRVYSKSNSVVPGNIHTNIALPKKVFGLKRKIICLTLRSLPSCPFHANFGFVVSQLFL